MKYCNKCNKFFDTDEVKCPVCGKGMTDALKRCDNCKKCFTTNKVKCPICDKDMKDVQNDDLSAEEIVSSMTITGIL